MSYAVGVVGHISREQRARGLAADVGAIYVSIDKGRLGCLGNHLTVWRHLLDNAPRAQWLVALEDDAVPCDGFGRQLGAVLRIAPRPVVSLYLGRVTPRAWQPMVAAAVAEAEQADASWIVSRHFASLQGYAIRRELVPLMLRHIDRTKPADDAFFHWVKPRRKMAFTWPSLVDHAEIPSVVSPDGAAPGRVAWRHGGRNTWTDRCVEMTP